MADDLTTDPKPRKGGRKPRISKPLAEAVRLILTGTCTTQKAAAERAGLTEGYLSEALRKPHVRVFVDQQTRSTIASGKMRASARLLALMDAGSEHVSLDATKHVLAIEGIKPDADAAVNVNIEVKAGYVIDLGPGRDDRPMVDVSPTRSAPAVTSTFGSGHGVTAAPIIDQPQPVEPIFRGPRR